MIPAGWQSVTPLAGGGGRPRVSAALPGDLERTGEAGIDSQLASYRGPNLVVRFDYGARAHPGCPSGVSRCDFRDTEIDGRAAKMSVSEAGVADRPFRSVHTYFVPLAEGAQRSDSSSDGAGMLLIVKCMETPACADAERIASTVRMSGDR